MAEKNIRGRKKDKQEKNEDGGQQEARQSEVKDDLKEKEQQTQTSAKGKNKKKATRKQLKEEIKTKTTGVGFKISVDMDSAPTNRKTVFDDSNLPTDEDDNDDSTHDKRKDVKLISGIPTEEEEDNDDDIVEEVQGKAARDEALDQIKTEAKRSLKTKKKRKRKPRKEKTEEAATKSQEYNDNEDDHEKMDADFFARLESVRKVELKERKELKKSAARSALKGRHTTFIFAKNKDDDETVNDPVQINENIQVVVLKNPSSTSEVIGNSYFVPNTSISKKALLYSGNLLKDGSDNAAGAIEMKRKRNRSGEDIQPWKRARQRLSMGRSRLTRGKPAAFFKTKKR